MLTIRKDIKKIIYIGTSSNIISIISNLTAFDLAIVICEKKRITQKYEEAVKNCNVKIQKFDTLNEFREIVFSYNPLSHIFLIYQFDFIVPTDIVSRYTMFNLHAGNMKLNRGAHPIIWSILNGETKTELSLHLINEKIDQGTLLGTYSVPIMQDDTPEKIKKNMENGIPKLLEKINFFLDGSINGEEIHGGIYHKKITEEDYTIDIHQDNKKNIENKIRSQSQYNGAIIYINKKKCYVKKIICWIKTKHDFFQLKRDKNFIEVFRDNEYFKIQTN